MGEFTLEATPVLGGFDHDFGGTRLRELVDMAAVLVSTPMGGEDAMAKAVKKATDGREVPKPGESYVIATGGRVMAFTNDQFMLLFDYTPHSAVAVMEKKLGNAGYYVEQTNNWVFLELSGPLARPALERICAIDTHPDKFPVDRAERTVMEHMGAILCRTGDDTFLVMSASSTGVSFLHALETSINYVS